MRSRNRYDHVAMTLHWVMAIIILGLLTSGMIMTGMKPGSAEQFRLYQIHKSVGALVFVLALARLIWRLGHRPPPLPETMEGLERLAAHVGHWGLYGLMLVMPLVGWAVVSTSPYNIPTILFDIIPLPHLPLPRAVNEAAKLSHATGAWIMIVMLFGHVGAALRHHWLLKDDVMTRMLPRFGRDS